MLAAALISRILLVAVGAILLAAVGFRSIFPSDDPYRCRALANTGKWLDRPDIWGDRLPFKNWQPDGCLMHQYKPQDIKDCMEGRHILFGGDSTSRQVAYGLARLLDRKGAKKDQKNIDFHSSFNLSYHGIQIQQHWVRFLETEGNETDVTNFVHELELVADDLEHPVSVEEQNGAALTMLGVGAWYSGVDRDPSKGQVEQFHDALINSSTILAKHNEFWTAPMDPHEGIGNQVFFAPPAGPVYTGKKQNKIVEKIAASRKVRQLQDLLRDTEDEWNWTTMWAIPELVRGQNKTWVDPNQTGFHVIDSVAEVKANILLNLRCNAKLDRLKGYPYRRTCCSDYGPKPSVQLGIVGFGLFYLVICMAGEILDLLARREKPRWMLFNMQTGAFNLALLMCYFADRTQMMAKGAKVWSYFDFILLNGICIAIAWYTIRKSAPPRPKPGTVAPVETDQPFLSRDQTDEWKGWMQFIILIYHWTAASHSKGVYITVRLLVAGYLFQTGYGHTTFFLAKKDYSFQRMASVVLRLNLLSCSLAYVMNTDYMNYYFSPLVTFWFLIVWLTMWIGHKQINDNVAFLVIKICVSALAIAFIVHKTPLTKWTFAILKTIFHIKWSLKEWQYRVALDLYVVYAGMLTAVAYLNIKQDPSHALRLNAAMAGLASIVLFFFWCLFFVGNMDRYRSWNPYVSFIPILAWVAIRNMTGRVRNYYSGAMAWLGQCSLETYTLQFHIFLASDTQAVLLVDWFQGGGSLLDRGRSLIITLPLFLWISYQTATATGNLVKVIMTPASDNAPDSEEKPEEIELDGEPFLYDPSEGVVGRSRSAVSQYLRKMPSFKSVIFSPAIRIIALLLVMWALNLLSP